MIFTESVRERAAAALLGGGAGSSLLRCPLSSWAGAHPALPGAGGTAPRRGAGGGGAVTAPRGQGAGARRTERPVRR